MRSQLVVVLLAAAPAFADPPIYRWVDGEGTHYTDDPSTIPSGRKVTLTQGVALGEFHEPKGREKAVERPRAERAGPDRVADAELAALAREWRAEFQRRNGRLGAANRELAAAKKQHEAFSRFLTTTDEWYGDLARIGDAEAELSSAREDLADLERAAARQAIPLEWRR
jgi:hypothetical protein